MFCNVNDEQNDNYSRFMSSNKVMDMVAFSRPVQHSSFVGIGRKKWKSVNFHVTCPRIGPKESNHSLRQLICLTISDPKKTNRN